MHRWPAYLAQRFYFTALRGASYMELVGPGFANLLRERFYSGHRAAEGGVIRSAPCFTNNPRGGYDHVMPH